MRNSILSKAVAEERKRLGEFIRRRVSNSEDAEDILQDVLYQLAASYSITEPIEYISAWLFTAARNKIIDWYRKKRPGRFDEQLSGDDEPHFLTEILPDHTQNPDRLYLRAMVWEELEDALDEMPPEQRAVFVMHELDGMSFQEIADVTGVPLNTLLSRKRYAVLRLRERLAELYEDLRTF
jgi:RNA polymerase sigma factor (sigma-70 family)